MTVARTCFILAGISLFSAVGVVFAQTQYQDQYCFSTPVSWNSVYCGCPIPNTPNDLCASDIPVPNQSWRTDYYCVTRQTETCTAPP